MQAILESTKVIYESEDLKTILDILLILGNVMNDGSFRGAALGFRISSINNVRFDIILSYLKPNQ